MGIVKRGCDVSPANIARQNQWLVQIKDLLIS